MKNQSIIISIIIVFTCGLLVFAMNRNAAKTDDVSRDSSEYLNDPRSVQQLLRDPDVKSSIDIREVLSGGVPKDGIPSIENPTVVSVSDAPSWLNVDGDGIAVSTGDTQRFYPYQVLVRHEIVNDTIEDKAVLVTYCPLCYTGIVFDRVLDGPDGPEVTEFGVSGSLHNSNLIMYNRSNPESLWAQASGEAIIGPRTGEVLEILNFDITTFDLFQTKYPDGEVIIGDAESRSSYAGEAPYGGDLRAPNLRFDNPGEDDNRLAPDDRIVGLIIDGVARAYQIEAVEGAAPFADEVGGRQLLVDWDKDLQAVRVFDVTDGNNIGDRVRIPLSASFWFSWVSTYPETTVFK